MAGVRVVERAPQPADGFSDVGEVVSDPALTTVYEHGWQTFSPAGLYPATATSPRPRRPLWQTMGYRPETPAPPHGFQGEGLLVVCGPDGATHLYAAPEPAVAVPSIRARVEGDRVVVQANGPVVLTTGHQGLAATLQTWADAVARAARVPPLRTMPAGWCSWYCYWGAVREQDVLDNLAVMDRLDLRVDVVQVDDGHQAEIGDWNERSGRFGPLSALADRITATGRRAGVWTAPFLVGARSRLAAEHPDWLVGDVVVSEDSWQQRVLALDVTHPDAAEHLSQVYRRLAAEGFSYFKLDFLLAGALPGRRHQDAGPLEAYRLGLQLVREAVGADALLLGCGAPLLPSIGLVDAMRVSPDVSPYDEPELGDRSQPGLRSAMDTGRARTWQHGRFWVNDPDCLIVRPEVTSREAWAEHVSASGGLVVSSDPLAALDERGIELTRRTLRPAEPVPVAWHPDAHPDAQPDAQPGAPARAAAARLRTTGGAGCRRPT